ncbi:MAG: PqqD family protein [Gemmatimonadota bacterium]
MLPRPHPGVLFQVVSEGAILLHTEQEVYFGLNGVGVEVWQMLPPAYTELAAVLEELSRRYPDVPRAELQSDVTELLDTLAQEGLVLPAGAA